MDKPPTPHLRTMISATLLLMSEKRLIFHPLRTSSVRSISSMKARWFCTSSCISLMALWFALM